ncbi:MAG: magnesium/cobalt transporter CorA [Pseudomonadota bacterium]|nr:magnesium/cobalt transporter CorA [Pseudomonadota bacterium]
MTRISGLMRPASHAGLSPGALVADPASIRPTIRLIAYSPDDIVEIQDCDIESALAARGSRDVVWIDVVGLGDVELIARIGRAFGLHHLALEDVVNLMQRPKVEEFDDHAFIVLRMMVHGRRPETEQMSIFVGEGFVISFQERPGDCLDAVRRRLRRGRGRVRREGADYLAYALIDAIVDGYFPVLEAFGEEIEQLEDEVLDSPRPEHVHRLHGIKRDLLLIRRALWPTRDMVNIIVRDEVEVFGRQARTFMRDVYDHSVQLMDVVETYREIASGLVEVYLSSQSARMNEVMKVLTIISTIFIPLGFLAGLWGMNFEHDSMFGMPELQWKYGYPAALGLMLAVALSLLWYFRRKGWIGRGGDQ